MIDRGLKSEWDYQARGKFTMQDGRQIKCDGSIRLANDESKIFVWMNAEMHYAGHNATIGYTTLYNMHMQYCDDPVHPDAAALPSHASVFCDDSKNSSYLQARAQMGARQKHQFYHLDWLLHFVQ